LPRASASPEDGPRISLNFNHLFIIPQASIPLDKSSNFMVKFSTMRKRLAIELTLLGFLLGAVNLQAFPALEYEAGPGIYAPLGGWTKYLGAGPILALKVTHPWKHRISFGAGVGFIQLKGKADPDLIYKGFPATIQAGYQVLSIASGQDLRAWVGGGVLQSQVTLSGGKETSTDPLAELGVSGSVPIGGRLGIALEVKYDEVFASKQDSRGLGFGLGLRYGR
jgi:hypothetical protein